MCVTNQPAMKSASSWQEFYQQLRIRKVPFFVAFFVTVFMTYFVLYVIDFIPEAPEDANTTDATVEATMTAPVATTTPTPTFSVVSAAAAHPVEIYFDRFERGVTVLNPTTTDITTLDQDLLSGVVRYPESADLTEKGNMLIFGHSSYLPNVFNKNFQAFNDIQKLTWGDKIRVYSDDTEYVYRVEKVYQAKATELTVPETPGESRLTLATCNVLGAKEDRYIVEASLLETLPHEG